jgi:maleate isomerase
MSANGYDYGRAGIVGIGTPQANPTVEAEMRIVLPSDLLVAVTRLTSRSEDPAIRLRAYLTALGRTLEHYDSLPIQAFGFACTASSYLIGRAREQALLADLQGRLGYPIVTATDAIRWRLAQAGAHRIALVSPYPSMLVDAATRFWREAGHDLVAVRRIETGSADTRSIYGLGSDDARAAVADASALDVDAVLLSGTGMPSLRLIADAAGTPLLLSSNLCLAQRLCDLLGLPRPEVADWRARLDHATPNRKVIA